jgi:ParB-like nuclease domain
MMLRVDEIVTGTRLRGLDPKAVGVLKESIKVIGLKVPISVRYLSDEEGYALVAGAHRLQACIELGMEEIPVQEEEGSELDARLWEIDENLCRSELTELERGEHLVARKAIYLQQHPETKAGAAQGEGKLRSMVWWPIWPPVPHSSPIRPLRPDSASGQSVATSSGQGTLRLRCGTRSALRRSPTRASNSTRSPGLPRRNRRRRSPL